MRAAAYEWPDGGTKQVVYIGEDRHIHELFVGADGDWRHADLTQVIRERAPVPLALPGSDIVGYSWSATRSKQVAFVGEDRHIHELYVVLGDPEGWKWADLTNETGAPVPVPAPGMIVGFTWHAGRSKQVAYVGGDGHLHELHCVVDRRWQYTDLTVANHWAWRASTTRRPLTAWSIDRLNEHRKSLLFVDQDGRLRQAWVGITVAPPDNIPTPNSGQWDSGSPWVGQLNAGRGYSPARDAHAPVGWSSADGRSMTVWVDDDGRLHEDSNPFGPRSIAGVYPAPDLGRPGIVGYSWQFSEGGTASSFEQIAYSGRDGHIHELVAEGGGWSAADLTLRAHGGDPCRAVIAGFGWGARQTKQVIYLAQDRSLCELWCPPQGDWSFANLTTRTGAPPVGP